MGKDAAEEPPRTPPAVTSQPPPAEIVARIDAAKDRAEPWSATVFDLSRADANDRRPRFATRAIVRTLELSTERAAELVRWLSTDTGYVNGNYACAASDPLGLRLARGPVVVDLIIDCGRIAIGDGPWLGLVAEPALNVLEQLRAAR